MEEFRQIESKWQEKWEESKIFEVERDERPKFYIAIVYPYVNGILHLGHMFTYNFSEVYARYKRMNNFNVLVKWGYHCTGTPIATAADKIRDGDEKQIKILKSMGVPDSEIPKFSDAEYWIDYFPKEVEKDIKKFGWVVDHRRTFVTTSLNKPYDAMIRWQFNKLKELGYVKKGKHPVVWCPKDEAPTGDHARSEGEGVTVKDFIWVKFRMKDSDLILVSGTTRPDALYGQTHLWIDPHGEYKVIKVNDEKWVVGSEAVEKVERQYGKVEVIQEIDPKELIGKWVKGPLVDYEIYTVPAWFIDSAVGSGIVYSALEDPVDLVEILHIQSNTDMIDEFKLDLEIVKKLKPISIIKIEGMSDNLGQDMIDKYKIKSPKEADKVKKAKDELNKTVFRKGIMKDNCGECAGLTIPKTQEFLKKKLVEDNDAVMFYELEDRVVCRCGTECVVKLVENQWFLEYNDLEWKKKAHECLDQMYIKPEKVRKQFDYVIDWLNHWACTREQGLGTKLPWDEKWLIESLSDSTIQMAYNTISNYLENPSNYDFSVEKLNDEFFDYVFLGKGSASSVSKSTRIDKELVEKMRKDFDYWYPFDFRNSAKDLVQNHLTFCMFNHVAIFPKEKWPKEFMVNGRVLVDNEKMSKSKGNFFTMRQLYEKYSADVVRLTASYAGETIDDANFDMTFLETANKKLYDLLNFVKENFDKGREEELTIDRWFESSVHECIKNTTEAMEDVKFKTAIKTGFLDMNRNLDWYMRRTNNNPNKFMINLYIESVVKMLAPFTPHLSEEIWEMIGKEAFISNSEWPKYDESKIDPEMNASEELITSLMDDIRSVLKLAKLDKPKKTEIFISPEWKYHLFRAVESALEKTQNVKEVMEEVMKDYKLKEHAKDFSRYLPKMIGSRKIPRNITSQDLEFRALSEAKEFLSREFGGEVIITKAEESSEAKSKQAMPGKVAILVE